LLNTRPRIQTVRADVLRQKTYPPRESAPERIHPRLGRETHGRMRFDIQAAVEHERSDDRYLDVHYLEVAWGAGDVDERYDAGERVPRARWEYQIAVTVMFLVAHCRHIVSRRIYEARKEEMDPRLHALKTKGLR
jgi:hypothetical protein